MAQRRKPQPPPQNEAIPPQPAPVVQEVDILEGGYPDFDPDSEGDGGYDGGVQVLDDDDGMETILETDVLDESEPIDLAPFGTEAAQARASASLAAEKAPPVNVSVAPDFDAAVQAEVARRLADMSAPLPATAQFVQVTEQPVIVAAPPESTFIVRPNQDIGPVFYGKIEIEMKKHVKYRVPESIFQYMADRDLIYSRS